MREAEDLGDFGSWDADLVTGKCRWSDALFTIYGFTPDEIEELGEIIGIGAVIYNIVDTKSQQLDDCANQPIGSAECAP